MKHERGQRTHLSLVACRDTNGHIASHGSRNGNKMSVTFGRHRTSVHRHGDCIRRHTRHTDAHWIGVTGIQNVHHIGGNRGTRRRRNHAILLQEIATNNLSPAVLHHDIATESMLAHTGSQERIPSFACHDPLTVDKNLWSERRVYGSHDDVCIETFARIQHRLLWNHVGIELIHADIFHVNVGNQRVKYLTFGITHITLEL